MKRALSIYVVVLALFAFVFGGLSYAAFTDKVKILGSTFNVGSAEIKLLSDLSKGTENENLADEITGPTFSGIGSTWQQNYLVKIYNNSAGTTHLVSNSNYTTATDPDELRSVIFVEPREWNDGDNDGVLDSGEEGLSYGKKTIIKWKTEGIELGEVPSGQVKGLVLKFSTDSLSDSKQGKSAVFDFEFNSLGL